MKKIILIIIFAFISLNSYAQLKVKDRSFVHNPNAVMDDKYEHIDAKGLPMALIKISTENIPEQERKRLMFKGNQGTQITKDYKTGQVLVYITAENARYIEISHPDYNQENNVYKYYFPDELCEFSIYEMVLQYIPQEKLSTMIVVESLPPAYAYIDGKPLGMTPIIENISAGEHRLVLSLDGYEELEKNFTIHDGDQLTLNEILRKEIIIRTDKKGDKIYIDKNYIGLSPLRTKVQYGHHIIEAKRDGYVVDKKITISQDDDNAIVLEFVKEITIRTDKVGDVIYVDGNKVGVSPVKIKLSYGTHYIIAKRTNFSFLNKTIYVTHSSSDDVELKIKQKINSKYTFNSKKKCTNGKIVNALSFLMSRLDDVEFRFGLSYGRIHLNKKDFGIGWFVDSAFNLESFSAICGTSLFFPKIMMYGINCLRLGTGVGYYDDFGLDLLIGMGGIIDDGIYSLDFVVNTDDYFEIRITLGLTW